MKAFWKAECWVERSAAWLAAMMVASMAAWMVVNSAQRKAASNKYWKCIQIKKFGSQHNSKYKNRVEFPSVRLIMVRK